VPLFGMCKIQWYIVSGLVNLKITVFWEMWEMRPVALRTTLGRSPNPCLPQQQDTISYAVKISVLHSWRWAKDCPKHVGLILEINKLLLLHLVGSSTRVGTSIVATIYLQLIQNRYMFRSFTVLQCSHQHCVQPIASNVEVIGYL